MAVASLLLALLVGAAFAVLLVAVSDLRASGRRVAHSRETNAAADRLEELVIDLETGLRGFVIARQERFLEPWRAARAQFPEKARALELLAESSVGTNTPLVESPETRYTKSGDVHIAYQVVGDARPRALPRLPARDLGRGPGGRRPLAQGDWG